MSRDPIEVKWSRGAEKSHNVFFSRRGSVDLAQLDRKELHVIKLFPMISTNAQAQFYFKDYANRSIHKTVIDWGEGNGSFGRSVSDQVSWNKPTLVCVISCLTYYSLCCVINTHSQKSKQDKKKRKKKLFYVSDGTKLSKCNI